jgi:hypothetical protein
MGYSGRFINPSSLPVSLQDKKKLDFAQKWGINMATMLSLLSIINTEKIRNVR